MASHPKHRPVQKAMSHEEYLKMHNVPVSEPQPGETAIYRNAEFVDELTSRIWTAPEAGTMIELFSSVASRVPQCPFLGTREKLEDGTYGDYQWTTYENVEIKVKKLAYKLQTQFGIKKGDCVGIWAKNCEQWTMTEFACYLIGALPVALYDTLGPDAVVYVIDHAECAVTFCSEDHVKDMVALVDPKMEQQTKCLRTIISFDNNPFQLPEDAKLAIYTFSELLESVPEGFEEKLVPADIKDEDDATILYTSGSTGVPKGVLLTHKNLIACCSGFFSQTVSAPWFQGGTHLSYLPLAHSYERLSMTGVLAGGGRVGDIKNLIADMAALKPTFLIGVPRVWQRIHDRIIEKIEGAGFVKKTLFNTMYAWKDSAVKAHGQSNPQAAHAITDSIVFNKIKQVLGGNVKLIFSGAAPLDPDLGAFLRVCFGCPVAQGYGLTETSAGTSCGQLFDAYASSHCGNIISSLEAKLRDVPEMGYFSTDQPQPRGELLVRGNNIFKEYYKNPEATAEAMTEDGWLCTGDIATLGPENQTMIIDRKKNIFKLSQGEYVAPEYLEIVYVRNSVVQQIFVHGESVQQQLVAVVVPEMEALKAHAIEQGLATVETTKETLLKSDAVKKALLRLLADHAKENRLKGIEKLHNIHLEEAPFSMENGLLTPSFKQKRGELRKRYQTVISEMYEEL